MAEQNNFTINDETYAEDTSPGDTGLADTAHQDQSASNVVTENQPTSSTASRRNWFLYLPPEVRLIVYHHVLQIPYDVPYNSQRFWGYSDVQAVTGILRTSRLFRREGIDVFFRQNIFFIRTLVLPFQVIRSRRIDDMIQNLVIDIRIPVGTFQAPRDLLIGIIHNFGDPAIIRRTFRVNFFLALRYIWRRAPLDFFIRGLGRFTNFEVVEIDLFYRRRLVMDTDIHRDRVEAALRFVLGPATPRAAGHGLTFLPQQFLRANAQPSREDFDWMDHLDGIRLDWNGDEN
ncbi:hypothetical protein MMC22_006575 [Lobaria immixta]|nr:hypothetical protein [Lobaria immixta]